MSRCTLGSLIEVEGGLEWDPDEIERQLARRRAHFAAADLQPGDRVLIAFGNRAAFFVELLAAWRLGACVIPVDTRSTPFEVETLARAAQARFAVVDAHTGADKREVLNDLGLTVLDTDSSCQGGEAIDAHERGLPLEADALILFTSGSTGEPIDERQRKGPEIDRQIESAAVERHGAPDLRGEAARACDLCVERKASTLGCAGCDE